MKRRRGMSGDSLELLLDTVCSMFGAITLIAILVSLLANTGSPNSAALQSSAEMTARRIAIAEADLKDALLLKEKLTPHDDDRLKALIAEKRRLETALKEARSEDAKASQDVQDSVTEQGGISSEEWKKLNEDAKSLQRRKTEAANLVKTQEQNAERLQSRIQEIGGQIVHEKEGRVVKLRFPREHEKTKQPYIIICKFGKIYPVRNPDRSENTKMIKWVEEERGKLSLPIESEGWTSERDESSIAGMLGGISAAESYVIFVVYPDSFAAYHGLRDRAISANLDFGMSIEPPGSRIYWSDDGSTPPPL